jgi:hypothetical protein
MGRNRWTSRLTVEDCPLCLRVATFQRSGMFSWPIGSTSTFSWTESSGFLLGRIECRLIESGPGRLAIYIRRQLARINVIVVEQQIPLTTTRPYLGGKRFWFLCGCGRRVGRLYLPPGQGVFRCRHCYNLTYWSARKHDPRQSRKRAAWRAEFLAVVEPVMVQAGLRELLISHPHLAESLELGGKSVCGTEQPPA